MIVLQKIKQLIIDWCLCPSATEIQKVHRMGQPHPCSIYDPNGELKFIEQTQLSGILVSTPHGLSPIINTHKTVSYQTWHLQTNNHQLECADTHIIIDEHGREMFVKDLTPEMNVQTNNGVEQVISVRQTTNYDTMYDLELDDDNHIYYTNGILSHNSITSAVFLLWFACFHNDKNILIASNKEKGAKEMIHRIRYAYENLPFFLKPGVTEDGWNKHSVAFDNGSRIDSTATSEDSGRGSSISLLFLDEFAFVKPGIQEEFWTSVLPTLSTGGACIMSSTPNGDSDKFAQLWREAAVGLSADMSEAVDEDGNPYPQELLEDTVTFAPHHIKWNEPPGRDDKFKKQQIGLLGELKWRQEYECEFLSSDALLVDSRVSANLAKLTTPSKYLKNDIVFWDDIKPNMTYLLGVDPSTGSGRDFSVIQLFEFPSLKQVAEYRANSMSSPELYAKLKWLLSVINERSSIAYFSVESNGVGEGIIALYLNDESPPDAEFVSEQGAKRYGMTTTNKAKIKACVNLKQVVESGKIQINSKVLITEIKTFVRKRGSYEAQYGSTDDCISAVLIVLRILEEIAAYDQDAFDRLYTYDESEYLDGNDDFGDVSDMDPDAMPISIG